MNVNHKTIKIIFILGNILLNLFFVSDDAGKYTCIATNIMGKAVTESILQVAGERRSVCKWSDSVASRILFILPSSNLYFFIITAIFIELTQIISRT